MCESSSITSIAGTRPRAARCPKNDSGATTSSASQIPGCLTSSSASVRTTAAALFAVPKAWPRPTREARTRPRAPSTSTATPYQSRPSYRRRSHALRRRTRSSAPPDALSVRWAQPGQGDRDEPADRGLGRQAAGCCEGVEAVARKLLGSDVIPDVARIRGLGQQVSDDLREVLLRSVSVLTSMQERREFAGVA